MGLTHEQLQGIIKTHQAKASGERQRWDAWRRWYLGEYWAKDYSAPTGAFSAETGIDDDDVNFETNYPYAYIDTMIANVCPTNPKITVNARRRENSESAKVREALINDVFYRQKLHADLWRLCTGTAICGRGFIKSVWNFKRETVEFMVVDPRFVFFDMSATRWEDIRYLVEVQVLTKAEFKSRVKKPGRRGGFYPHKVMDEVSFGGYPSWLKDYTGNRSMVNDASKDVYNWATVYEFYDFENKKYYHVLDGVDEPIFEGDLPYSYVQNPFVMLQFNENMKDLAGLSDIALISSLQQRLNELDTLELWHAQTSIPVTLIQSSLVDNPEQIKTAIRDATEPGSVVDIHGKADVPLRDLFGSTPQPGLTPSFDKMRARAQQVIEFVLGVPQYSRGVVGVTDVATEVALADSATRTRNGRRIKAVNDVITALSQNTIALFEEFLDPQSEIVARIMDTKQPVVINRRSIGQVEAGGYDYDYEAVAYSPAENNKLAQLRSVQSFLPVLLQAQNVDKTRLVTKLLDLLNMSEVAISEEEMQAQAAQAQAQMAAMMQAQAPPGMNPAAAMTPSPDDTIATGGLPPGTEPPQMPLEGGGAGSTLPNSLRGNLEL
jgi:hypothetical protein